MHSCYHFYRGIATDLLKFTKISQPVLPVPGRIAGTCPALQPGLQLGLQFLIPRLAQQGVHIILIGRPTGLQSRGDPGALICAGGVNPPGIKVLPAAKHLVWRPYSRASSVAFSSSYPGLPSRAYILFL